MRPTQIYRWLLPYYPVFYYIGVSTHKKKVVAFKLLMLKLWFCTTTSISKLTISCWEIEFFDILSKKWYIDVLARIRINSFRIELALGSYEDILLSAAASVEAEAAVGNAIYILPSFYNHDCDPNAHILWIESVNAKLKALRDIEAGEELRICYIDASMDRDARRAILSEGFGFDCKCARCMSND
ncbi:hypothetical protein H5410_015615 [Solanum commersonii]|uniref:SET domain-containing protein n=1 Tax=Solanum commersonii TaxID=4109 RepID=A0A9J5ZV21_SOLCO|nr:hypothetical protein H5410_015615 [Solanum commersonii]